MGRLPKPYVEFAMEIGTKTVLEEASRLAAKTAERVADNKAQDAQTEIHHFSCYGNISQDDVAAFAAVKVLLERAIAAERETHRGSTSLNVRRRRRHYVVRLITNGGAPTSPVDEKLDPKSSLLGTMSVQHYNHSAYTEFNEEGDAPTSVLVRVCPTQSGQINRPVPVRLAGRMRGTFEFTVVNENVTHCVWIASRERDWVSEKTAELS